MFSFLFKFHTASQTKAVTFFIFLLFINAKVFCQKTVYTYHIKNDSTQNFYLALVPEKKIKGLLIILPGFGTMPDELIKETDLPQKAVEKNFLVVIPVLDKWDTFYMDTLCVKRFDSLVDELHSKFKIPANKFILGGHSIGGTGAVLYAEQSFQYNKKIKPDLVFGVDPPLDMKRMWLQFERNQKLNFSEISANEGKFMQQYFIKKFGGSPFQKPKAYLQWSPYFHDDEKGGNTKYLTTIPVRFYCDPDVNWSIENRRGSYENMNAFDLSAMIVDLKLLGNTKAELITALGKGYLADGRRHPHAFSMLNADDFLIWVEKNLK